MHISQNYCSHLNQGLDANVPLARESTFQRQIPVVAEPISNEGRREAAEDIFIDDDQAFRYHVYFL